MGFTKPAYWKQSPPPSTGDMNEERYRNQIAVLELVGAQAPKHSPSLMAASAPRAPPSSWIRRAALLLMT